MSILQRQQYNSLATHPTASSSPLTPIPHPPFCPSPTLQSKAHHPHPRRHGRRDREFARGLRNNPHLLPPHARGAALILFSACLRSICDAILDDTCRVHQHWMAAMRSALKKRSHGPAPSVEHDDDPGRPVRGLVRVCDRVFTEAESARAIAERLRGALETFGNGKSSAVILACDENQAHDHTAVGSQTPRKKWAL